MLTEVYYGKQHPFFAELPAQVCCAVLPPVLLARQDPEGCQENEEHGMVPSFKGQSEICVTNATCHIRKLMNYHLLN